MPEPSLDPVETDELTSEDKLALQEALSIVTTDDVDALVADAVEAAVSAEAASRAAADAALQTAIGNLNGSSGTPSYYVATNPNVGSSPYYVPAVDWHVTYDASQTEIGFPTVGMHGMSMVIQDGHNDVDQISKTTWSGQNISMVSYGQGQRILIGNRLTAFGVGDAIIVDKYLECYGGLNASGDEGQKIDRYYMLQGPYIQRTTVAAIARAAIDTTNSQDILPNMSPQTVSVANATGCSVGDWIQFDVGLPGPGDVLNQTPYSRAEAVQVMAVAGNNITAIFRHSHPSGCLVKGSTVISFPQGTSFGQGRYLVNLSATPHTTGQARGNGINNRALDLTGSGTNWSVGMVGGNQYNIGVLSFDVDETPNYDGIKPLRVFYPLWDLTSTTHLKMHRRDQVGLAIYQGRAATPGNNTFFNYKVHPGARIMKVIGNTAIAILEYNSFNWQVGDTVECAHSHSFDCAMATWRVGMTSPGGTYRHGIELSNAGPQDFETGISIGYSAGDYGGRWITGLAVTGSREAIQISVDDTAHAIQIGHSDTQRARIDWSNRQYIEHRVTGANSEPQHGMRIKTAGLNYEQFLDFYAATAYGVDLGRMQFAGDFRLATGVNLDPKFEMESHIGDKVVFETYFNSGANRSGLKIFNVSGVTKTLIGTIG